MLLCLVAQSCPTLCNLVDCSPPDSSVHGDSPGKNTGVGCHAFFQGNFPIQGLNPGLPHCRQILYCLSHQGSPRILEWVAYPFSRGSSWPRNQTGLLHCRQTLYQLSYQGSTKSTILPIKKNLIQELYQIAFPTILSRSALFTKLSSALGTINLLNVCWTELQNHYVSLLSNQGALLPDSVNSFFLLLPTLLLQALTLFLSKILLPLGKGKRLSLQVFLPPLGLLLLFLRWFPFSAIQMAASPKFSPWLASLQHRVSTGAMHALLCLQLMLMARVPTRRISKLLRISDYVCLPNSAPPGTPLHHSLVPYSQAVTTFCLCNSVHPSQAPLSFIPTALAQVSPPVSHPFSLSFSL